MKVKTEKYLNERATSLTYISTTLSYTNYVKNRNLQFPIPQHIRNRMFSKIPTKLSVKKISRASSCYVQSLSTIPTPPRDRTAAAAFASQTRIVYKKVNTTKKHDNGEKIGKKNFPPNKGGRWSVIKWKHFYFNQSPLKFCTLIIGLHQVNVHFVGRKNSCWKQVQLVCENIQLPRLSAILLSHFSTAKLDFNSKLSENEFSEWVSRHRQFFKGKTKVRVDNIRHELAR